MYRFEPRVLDIKNDDGASSFYALWRQNFRPRDLRIYLEMTLGIPDQYTLPGARFMDVLLIVSKGGGQYMYFANGEKVIVPFNTTVVEDWLLKEWFVKIASGVLINMLYVDFPLQQYLQLQLDKTIERRVLEHMSKRELAKLLEVGRRMSDKNVKPFAYSMHLRMEKGWGGKLFDT